MMPDSQLEFSTQQALTATANSTNIVDKGGPINLGAGEPIHAYISLCGVAPGGTNPTLTATLVGADDAAFSVNKITIGSVTPVLVSGTIDTRNYEIPIGSNLPKRYFRIEYTLGGTSPTVTVTAGFVEDLQTHPSPPLS